MIAVVAGQYLCYSTDNGIRKHFRGCAHDAPRAAIRHVATDPYVSPLRASDGTSTPVPSAPLPGLGLSDVPSEPRLGDPPRP